MPLPGDLTTVAVTGTFTDPAGEAMRGRVTFTPGTTLSDATGEVVIPMAGRTYWLGPAGSFETDPLAATDNADISPTGWTYTILVELEDVPPYSFSAFLPHIPSVTDLSTLVPVVPQPPSWGTAYLPLDGGTVEGLIFADGGIVLDDSAGDLWLLAVLSGVLTALPVLQDEELGEIFDEGGHLMI